MRYVCWTAISVYLAAYLAQTTDDYRRQLNE